MKDMTIFLKTSLLCQLFVIFSLTHALFIIPVQSGYAEPLRVIYGFDREFAPFSYEDPGGKPVGFEVELVQAIFMNTDVNLVTRPLRWDVIPLELSSGSINLTSGMIRTDQRAKLYQFSEKPTFIVPIRLFTKTYKRVPSLSMLRGQMVSVDQGSYQQYLLENFGGINVKPFSDRTEGLRALYNDAVAAYCGPMPNTYYYINKLNYGAITTVGTPLATTEMRVAVNKNRGDILRFVNQGMTRILENGEYHRIYRKWFVRELSDEERSVMIRSAILAAIPSYTPYSGSGRGAAILTATGKIFTGCDVENADPILSFSAIRSALARTVAEGEFEPRAVVLTSADGKIIDPSPDDLQSIYEFGMGTLIVKQVGENAFEETMAAQLLPEPVTRPIVAPAPNTP